VRKASAKTFNQTANFLIYVTYKQSNGFVNTAQYNPVECLRQRKHPRKILLEWFPESEIISFSVNVGMARIAVGHPPKEVDEAKFNEFWKLCLELENENEIYKRALQKQSELLRESKIIFKELEKRMEDIIPS
jgi:hypothetical protein